MSKKKKGNVHLYTLIPGLLILILAGGAFQMKKTIHQNQLHFAHAMDEVRSIDKVIQALSDLTRWQFAVLNSDTPKEVYHAKRRVAETADIIQTVSQTLNVVETGDPELTIKQHRLLELNDKIIDQKDVHSEPAHAEYRSIHGILKYRYHELQNKVVVSAEKENTERLLVVVSLVAAATVLTILASIFLVINILLRNRAEYELKKTKNYLHNVINSMPSMLVGIEPDGSIMEINRKSEIACGVPAAAARGRHVGDLFPVINPYLEEITKKIFAREILEKQHVPLPDNPNNIVNITAFPLVMNGIQGAVVRLDNVTQQVKMEEQLRQSQKMTAVGQLAGGVSHDFNNMLSGIIGAVELLDDYVLPEGAEFLEIIRNSSVRASDLTKQLLSFSRKNKMLLKPVDVNETIESVASLLCHSIPKTIQIETDLTEENHIVSGDATQLQNIFLNLGINSSHAIENKGVISYSTKVIELDGQYCDSSQFDLTPGSYLQVEVSDTGCGIPAEHLNRIFDPFFTTKEEGVGTGLGLSTVFGIIQGMKGSITVYSELGRGTLFHVLLPISTEEKKVEELVDQESGKNSGKILVIDDEKVIRVTASAILTKAGYEVSVASNGREGLDRIQEAADGFDLILLDMIMPVMNGRDCFTELKKIAPQIPVILASGFSQHKDVDAMRAMGLDAFIRKPYKGRELLDKIDRVLSK